ncbi:MAG: hypothetical protein LBO20_07065 [Bifidobacteriaceae bacterium]|nr:hypothetical protein [Bifidobacteriaceae bacterium]
MIAPTLVASDGMSRRLGGGISALPGYRLARLALDVSLQGQGLGWDLLWDALETICAAARIGGGRIVVVDPVSSTAAGSTGITGSPQ